MAALTIKSIHEIIVAQNPTLVNYETHATRGSYGRSVVRGLPPITVWSDLTATADDSDDPQNASDSDAENVGIIDVPDDLNGWAHLSAFYTATGAGTSTVTANPAGYLWGRYGPGFEWLPCMDRHNNISLITFAITTPLSYDDALFVRRSPEYAVDIAGHRQLLFLPTVALAQTGVTLSASGVRMRLTSF